MHIEQQTHGPNSPALGPTGGSVTIIYRISEEKSQALAAELSVTDAALRSFFTILEQQHVPRQELDSTLREIAIRYKDLQEQLQTFTSEDPAVVTLKREASKALEGGDFARAEKLLNEASARDIEGVQHIQEAIQQLQENKTKRLLSAAASKADIGGLKETRLRYGEGATYYRQAAEMIEAIPNRSDEILATYLENWKRTAYQAGDYNSATSPLTHLPTIWEKVLGPDHPRVATSLNNLAELYR